jgi:pimeloyl-ACP methyl ester carboxylesterase
LVVWIHGFGEDGTVWKYQVEYLRSRYTLLIPDLPGSGKSRYLDTNAEHAIQAYAEIVRYILDREDIVRCTMIGHSMGGYVALAFAAGYESRLNGLGLFHSTAYADSTEKKEARAKGIEFIRKHGAAAFLKQATPNLFGKKFTSENDAAIQELIAAGSNFSANALVQYYTAMMHRPDRIEVLKKFPKPVLFVIGEEDKSVSLQDSLNQCHLPGLSLINILPDAAHMGMWEMKDQANATIVKFLNYASDALCD